MVIKDIEQMFGRKNPKLDQKGQKALWNYFRGKADMIITNYYKISTPKFLNVLGIEYFYSDFYGEDRWKELTIITDVKEMTPHSYV